MKKFYFVLLALLFSLFTWANPVDSQTALKAAQNFFKALTKSTNVNFALQKEYKYDGKTVFYIFSAEDKFVLIAADDQVTPILAYSTEGSFSYPITSPEVRWWLSIYARQIASLQQHKTQNPKANEQWKKLLSGDFVYNNPKATYLVQTTWNQTGGDTQYPYNYFCPDNTPVGCVATATAQVLRYWKYPNKGRGWHSYEHPTYGQLYAIFDTTTYRWNNMPLDASSYDVALLSYQIGVSIDMDYEPSGSGAFTYNLTHSLANYFGYSHDIIFYYRSYIESIGGEQAWKDTLIKQINNGWPMVYAGYSKTSGGHAFVCDGYDSGLDKFHFNWGWGGSYDGWYTIDNLEPGNSSFNDGQSAVVNIHPDNSVNHPFYFVMTQGPANYRYTYYIDAVNNKVAYASGDAVGGISKTIDGGGIWHFVPFSSNFADYEPSMVFAVNEDTIFVPVFQPKTGVNTYLLKSTDGGKTWEAVVSAAKPGTSFFNLVYFFDSKRGILQGDPVDGEFELYYTEDGGNTWTRVDGANIPDAWDKEYGTVGHLFGNSTTVWFLTTKGRVFRSTDYGKTWTVVNLVTPQSFGDNDGVDDYVSAEGMVRDDGVGVIAETYYEYTPTDTTIHYYYFRTTDNGDTWTKYTPTGTFGVNQIRVAPEGKYFVSVGPGINYSFDGGLTWQKLTNYYQLFRYLCLDFGTNDSTIFLGSYSFGITGNTWSFGVNNTVTPRYATNIDRACINTPVVFNDSSIGPVASATWDFGQDADPQTATGLGPHTVTYSSAGDKQVTLTVTNTQGQQFTYTGIFTVDQAPPTAFDKIDGETLPILNKTYTYSVPEVNAHYKWKIPSLWSLKSDMDTNAITVFVNGELGDKVISVTPYNGCGLGPTTELKVTVINNVDNPYPNPATDVVFIEKCENSQIYVYDSKGNLVESFRSDDYIARLNVADSRYTNGIYTVKIVYDDGSKRVLRILVLK